MEWIILAAIVGAALTCPTMMFGTAVVQRLGLRKGSAASMSCTGTQTKHWSRGGELEVLRRRRAELDDEISMTQILAQGAARRGNPAEDRQRDAP